MSVGLWLYVNSFCNIKFSHSKCEISNPEFEMLAIIREIELTVCVCVCLCVCVCVCLGTYLVDTMSWNVL